MIYDVFSFFNERELLYTRLNELYDHVDKFIVVESNKTFQGNDKPFHLQTLVKEPKFIKFRNKIVIVRFNSDRPFPECKQKNSAWVWLDKHATPLDIIHFSDLDEIPIAPQFTHLVRRLPKDNYITLHGRFFCYGNDRLRMKSDGTPCYWHGGVVAYWDFVKSKFKNGNKLVGWRDGRGGGIIASNSCVHLSYYGDIETIRQKFMEWGHANEKIVRDFVPDLKTHIINGDYYANTDRVVYINNKYSAPTILLPSSFK